jgi:hypothetical protein
VATVVLRPADRSARLTAGETAVYALLVGRPPATAHELAAAGSAGTVEAGTVEAGTVEAGTIEAGMVEAGMVEALAGLVVRGLVTVWPDAPPRYSAVAPEVALDATLRARDDELREARRHIDELARAYDVAVARSGRTPVELVTGPAVPQRIAQVLRVARSQMRCLERCTGLPGAPLDAGTRPPQPDVAWRTIYERDVVARPDALPRIQRMTRDGQQVRVVAALPTTLYLADSRLAVLPVPGEPGGIPSAVVVHPCSLLDALDAFFEALWERALPLGPATPATTAPNNDGDAREELDVLILLLAGLTDQAIARRIGVGHRTAQRRIAALLKDLGARTRFQAGVQAALRDLK